MRTPGNHQEAGARRAERRAPRARSCRIGGEAPLEADYRYPGPKPRSPETAIVMLADAVEGATRSLKEPTAPKIQTTVHKMIMKRLLDGQRDESGPILSDLHPHRGGLDEDVAFGLSWLGALSVGGAVRRPGPGARERRRGAITRNFGRRTRVRS